MCAWKMFDCLHHNREADNGLYHNREEDNGLYHSSLQSREDNGLYHSSLQEDSRNARDTREVWDHRAIVDDVRMSDLEPLLQHVEEVKDQIDKHENQMGRCLHNPHRQFFCARCEGCTKHMERLREELRGMYRELGMLSKEADVMQKEACGGDEYCGTEHGEYLVYYVDDEITYDEYYH